MKKMWSFFYVTFSFCILNSSEISYSPDEKYAAVISKDGRAQICEAKLEIKSDGDSEFKQQGVKIVLDPLIVLRQTDKGQACSVCWSSDGKLIAIGSSSGIVDLWLGSTVDQIKLFKTLKVSDFLESVSGLSWSADNKFLAIVLKDKIIKVWGDFDQSSSGKEFFNFDLTKDLTNDVFQVDTLDWSLCGKFIAISGGSSDKTINSIILDVRKIYENMDSVISFTHQKPEHQQD